jgi:hypothetical protein
MNTGNKTRSVYMSEVYISGVLEVCEVGMVEIVWLQFSDLSATFKWHTCRLPWASLLENMPQIKLAH